MTTNKGLAELAIFGGEPTFSEKLHVGRPNIGDRARLVERIDNLLDTRLLTNNGPYVQEFEQRVAECVGVKHCIATCNATVALEIVIKAIGLTGEVIVPSFTFIATAHVLRWQDITPVFCDVNPDTHSIDPHQVESLITSRTTGILGVHVWGQPCEIDALTELANYHKLTLLFDAAHAFGCSYNGKMIGNFGAAEVFSFHATKFVNTFEGGAIVTNDDDLALRLRLMRNFGFAGYDKVVSLGLNGKMSEISAAMGLTSLESLDDFTEINRCNYLHYQQELADIPGVRMLLYDEAQQCNYQYIVFEVDEHRTQISRDHLLAILWAENILARRYFFPGCHNMEPYFSEIPREPLQLSATESLVQRVLVLPTGTTVDQATITKICQIIKFALENAFEIKQRMPVANKLDVKTTLF